MILKMYVGLLFIAASFVVTRSSDAQTVQELLQKAPEDANTVAVIRLNDLMNSPRGVKENWAQKHEEGYLNGGIPIPPWVERFVRASYVRPGAPGGEWTSVLLSVPEDFTMEYLAEKENSEVQEIDGFKTVLSGRRNGYFVEFADSSTSTRILGGIAPATRQDVARWITDEQSKLSTYLREAVEHDSSHITLAVDLKHMLDPVQIRYRLSGLKSLEDNSQARIALTLDFQSIQGLRLNVVVKEDIAAEVRFDFGRQIGDEGKYVKSLLNEFLNDAGMAIDELDQATVQTSGKVVTLNMPLGDESLRRILSLITTVSPATEADAKVAENSPPTPGAVKPAQQSQDDMAAKSLKYYRAVNDNVNDMERAYKRINNYRQTAGWHDKYARRIDELPIAGVDPELLDYGQKMSSLLQALGASLRGMGMKVDTLNNQITYEVEQKPVYRNGADWWWGGAWTAYGPYTYGQPTETEVHTNLQDVRSKQAEIVANSQPEREKIWQMINEERSTTRRKMVAKYGSDFQK